MTPSRKAADIRFYHQGKAVLTGKTQCLLWPEEGGSDSMWYSVFGKDSAGLEF